MVNILLSNALQKADLHISTTRNFIRLFSWHWLILITDFSTSDVVSVGTPGSASDGGVFRESALCQAFEEGYAGLPEAEPLPGDAKDLPFAMIADYAFGLRTWMMKPFSARCLSQQQRVFNSRARRVVENAFGILACRYS